MGRIGLLGNEEIILGCRFVSLSYKSLCSKCISVCLVNNAKWLKPDSTIYELSKASKIGSTYALLTTSLYDPVIFVLL